MPLIARSLAQKNRLSGQFLLKIGFQAIYAKFNKF
jgi:hypothetical protein